MSEVELSAIEKLNHILIEYINRFLLYRDSYHSEIDSDIHTKISEEDLIILESKIKSHQQNFEEMHYEMASSFGGVYDIIGEEVPTKDVILTGYHSLLERTKNLCERTKYYESHHQMMDFKNLSDMVSSLKLFINNYLARSFSSLESYQAGSVMTQVRGVNITETFQKASDVQNQMSDLIIEADINEKERAEAVYKDWAMGGGVPKELKEFKDLYSGKIKEARFIAERENPTFWQNVKNFAGGFCVSLAKNTVFYPIATFWSAVEGVYDPSLTNSSEFRKGFEKWIYFSETRAGLDESKAYVAGNIVGDGICFIGGIVITLIFGYSKVKSPKTTWASGVTNGMPSLDGTVAISSSMSIADALKGFLIGAYGMSVSFSAGARFAENLDRYKKIGESRKNNPTKSESEIWNSFEKVKGKDRRTSGTGSQKKYYEWDHTHNDIEVYDKKGNHLGSMDPTSGEMYKPPVNGRTIKP